MSLINKVIECSVYSLFITVFTASIDLLLIWLYGITSIHISVIDVILCCHVSYYAMNLEMKDWEKVPL